MLRLIPDHSSATNAPVTARGTDSMMISGWIQLSNWAASTRNTITKARPKVMYTAAEDSSNSRLRPW